MGRVGPSHACAHDTMPDDIINHPSPVLASRSDYRGKVSSSGGAPARMAGWDRGALVIKKRAAGWLALHGAAAAQISTQANVTVRRRVKTIA